MNLFFLQKFYFWSKQHSYYRWSVKRAYGTGIAVFFAAIHELIVFDEHPWEFDPYTVYKKV
jgi:hypothetical protein